MAVKKSTWLVGWLLAAITLSVSSDRCVNFTSYDDLPTFLGIIIICKNSSLTSVPKNFTNPTAIIITYNVIPIVSEIPYPKLEKLYLEYDAIRFVEDGAFGQLEDLTTLILSHNHISSLRPETFKGLGKLDLLSLEDNELFTIRADVFTGNVFPSLSILKLESCNIYEIESESFSGLNHLVQLNISSNRISRLPVIANTTLKSLKDLRISSNQITNIESKSFANMVALEELYLDDNFISRLTPESLSSLKDSLTTLNLRHNQISSMDSNSLYAFVKLDSLDLSYNQLTVVDSSCIPWDSFTDTKKILIHDNPWDCGNCDNNWIVEEDIVKEWNFDSSVRCASPANLAGRNIYDTNVPNQIFEHCVTVEPNYSSPATTIVLVVGFLLLTAVAVVIVTLIVVRRRRKRRRKNQLISYGKAFSDGNGLFSYNEMDEKSQFSIDDDPVDNRQEL